jgi:hypothetical protein
MKKPAVPLGGAGFLAIRQGDIGGGVIPVL